MHVWLELLKKTGSVLCHICKTYRGKNRASLKYHWNKCGKVLRRFGGGGVQKGKGMGGGGRGGRRGDEKKGKTTQRREGREAGGGGGRIGRGGMRLGCAVKCIWWSPLRTEQTDCTER